MSLGNLVAVVFGLAFGGALLMLSPAAGAMVGLAAAVTILRFPFWGLLLFALVATFMPYSTVNVGIRSTVSEAILALTWGAVLWHIFLSRLPPAPALRYRSTERMLLWLMLFTVLPFVVGQVSIRPRPAACRTGCAGCSTCPSCSSPDACWWSARTARHWSSPCCWAPWRCC